MKKVEDHEVICTKCCGEGGKNIKVPCHYCSGTGELTRWGSCSKCLGDGKLDWIENVAGRKPKKVDHNDTDIPF